MSRFGDWKLDTVIEKKYKQALVTTVEGKSRLTLINKVTRKQQVMSQMPLSNCSAHLKNGFIY